MAKVVIFGAGIAAGVAYRYFTKDSEHQICAFTVERQYRREESLYDLPIVDFDALADIFPPDEHKMFVALGSQNLNKLRYEKYRQCKNLGYELVSYVCSSVLFQEEFQVGDNCFILHNHIGFDARIGNNVTIWSGSHIGSRNIIEDNCWIAPHACLAADVAVKPFSFIGINSSISNGVCIAEENFIGANVLITRDTTANQVYLVERTAPAQITSDKFFALLKSTF